MPALLPFRSKPTVPVVTTSQVSDADIGLPEDSIAQANAEQFVRAALSFKRHQAAKAKRAFNPTTIRVALPADSEAETETDEVSDVASILDEKTRPIGWSDMN